MPSTVLIVGATRGLGASLAEKYASDGSRVIATARGEPKDKLDPSIVWITGIDVATAAAGETLVAALRERDIASVDILIITAGLFHLEKSLEPNFAQQTAMYATCAIGPTCLVSALATSSHLARGAKTVLISSESGSITLRHATEGGGAYGHHASKTALNMCGRLLAIELRERGVCVVMLHPGFMRTEMTKGVGFDRFWEGGGAVLPGVAAGSLVDFVRDRVGMEISGEYWAPRGAGDIGTAEHVLGPKDELPTPLQLPW